MCSYGIIYMNVYGFPCLHMPPGTSFVRAGNCIATRFCMLAVLALVLGCNYAATWHGERRKFICKIPVSICLQTEHLRWNSLHHPHLSIGLISNSWLACTKQHSSVCFLTELGNRDTTIVYLVVYCIAKICCPRAHVCN